MIDKIIERLKNVTITQHTGQLFADKSYKYDTIFFLSKFILQNLNAENCFEYGTYEKVAIEYVKDIFNLQQNGGNQKIKNYLNETITLLQYANILDKKSKFLYKVLDVDILRYMSICPENSYIFQYLVAYMTLKNDNKLELYKNYVNSDIETKKKLIKIFESYIKQSPGVDRWSPFKTKFLLMVLGYANNELEIARTLNIHNKKISTESISINVEGTKTPSYLPKKNDYIQKFNKQYVLRELKNYLFINFEIIKQEKVESNIANELAELKIDMLKAKSTMRQQSSIDQEQFVELAIKSRNQNVQRIFRDGLFKNNKHRCPLCGFEYKDFLIASHIVPYSKCEDTYDAINYYNGLLLCPNHDKLFEGARLMTIDASTGKVILSDKVVNSKDFKDLQGIIVDKSLIECERRHYLKWHNQQFKKINSK